MFTTAVHPGELLTSIRIPAKGDARDGWASATLGKEGTGIVSVAATVSDGNARHRDRLRRGHAGRAHRERRRDGRRRRRPSADLDPPGDVHASADYRRHLAEVLAARAVRDAA